MEQLKTIGYVFVIAFLCVLSYVLGHRNGINYMRGLRGITPPEKDVTKIAVIGDSQVYKGYLGNELQLLLNQLDDGDMRYVVKSFGIIGETTYQLYLRRAMAYDYDHVIILSGINQINKPAEVIHYLLDIFRDLKKREKLVIAVTLPPWGSYKGANPQRIANWEVINEWLKMKPGDIDYTLDSEIILRADNLHKTHILGQEYDVGDGLHVNEEGMRNLGRSIFQWFYLGHLGQEIAK